MMARSGATPISPDLAAELVAVMAKIARVTLRAELRAERGAPAGIYADRVRHDRTPLPRRSVLAAIRLGALDAVKVGKFWFIERAELDRYFVAHKAQERLESPAEQEDDFTVAMRRSGFRKGAVAHDGARGARVRRASAKGTR